MALQYHMWSEEEINSRNVCEEGEYQFSLTAATKKKTKGGIDINGNEKPIRDMLELEFEFFDNNGVTKKTRDWIVFMEGMDWKLRHLADCIGKLDLYESGVLDVQHLMNGKGSFRLGIKEQLDKDNVKKKVNFVNAYVKKSNCSAKLDQDIPF